MLSSRSPATAGTLCFIFPLAVAAQCNVLPPPRLINLLSPLPAHHSIITGQHDSKSTSILTILATPPTSITKFLFSLALLAILTFLGQKFAAEISYWSGWVWRRSQGESGYEEGKKVVGWDSEDEEAEEGGEVEYVVGSEVGKMLDYVVSVDDGKADVGVFKKAAGNGGVRERMGGMARATASRGV
ncbi:hypothetical protein EV426DRAFT_707138 [Tirmania nivea]|nr:hypothetical protein EV426DRAFT_707138 [Tirmania nivea]